MLCFTILRLIIDIKHNSSNFYKIWPFNGSKAFRLESCFGEEILLSRGSLFRIRIQLIRIWILLVYNLNGDGDLLCKKDFII
jgi:hypothetical protein